MLSTANSPSKVLAFLLHIATAHPSHTDYVLQTAQILIKYPSFLLINSWDCCFKGTFEEMFQVSFQEDVDDTLQETLKFQNVSRT